MKHFMSLISALLLSLSMLGKAEAVLINGNLTFGGGLRNTFDLSTINTVDFNPQNGIVSATASGDFAAAGIVPFVTTVVFQDFQFSPFVPNNPLWTVSGFTMALNSLTIDENDDDSLVLLGNGTVTKAGFDPTPFLWSFSADRTRDTVAFSMTNAAVPEPSSLLLLGSGLIAFGVLRRRRNG